MSFFDVHEFVGDPCGPCANCGRPAVHGIHAAGYGQAPPVDDDLLGLVRGNPDLIDPAAEVIAIRERLFNGFYDFTDEREPWTDFGIVIGVAERALEALSQRNIERDTYADAARFHSTARQRAEEERDAVQAAPKENDSLLTAQEIGDLLGVPERWVREHTRGGLLPHVRLGRYVRYRRATIVEWIDKQETRGASWRRYRPERPRD